ncbi:hypothetical protein Tco_0609873, partial [Tanacetum coccineum]
DDDDDNSSGDDVDDNDEDEEEEEHLAPADLADAVTTALPLPSLPPLPPSLYIPPHVSHRDDIPESEQPPSKRSCLFVLGSRYEVK